MTWNDLWIAVWGLAMGANLANFYWGRIHRKTHRENAAMFAKLHARYDAMVLDHELRYRALRDRIGLSSRQGMS